METFQRQGLGPAGTAGLDDGKPGWEGQRAARHLGGHAFSSPLLETRSLLGRGEFVVTQRVTPICQIALPALAALNMKNYFLMQL